MPPAVIISACFISVRPFQGKRVQGWSSLDFINRLVDLEKKVASCKYSFLRCRLFFASFISISVLKKFSTRHNHPRLAKM